LHAGARRGSPLHSDAVIVFVSASERIRGDPLHIANFAGTAVAISYGDVERRSTVPSPTRRFDEDVYDLPTMPGTDDLMIEWQSGAAYTLDQPVRCPHCRERINSLRIVGLTRSQVAFTSSLPPKGHVIVCPECERILTAELVGLV
jgi:hypothetical protein